jgi:hypothetical protein
MPALEDYARFGDTVITQEYLLTLCGSFEGTRLRVVDLLPPANEEDATEWAIDLPESFLSNDVIEPNPETYLYLHGDTVMAAVGSVIHGIGLARPEGPSLLWSTATLLEDGFSERGYWPILVVNSGLLVAWEKQGRVRLVDHYEDPTWDGEGSDIERIEDTDRTAGFAILDPSSGAETSSFTFPGTEDLGVIYETPFTDVRRTGLPGAGPYFPPGCTHNPSTEEAEPGNNKRYTSFRSFLALSYLNVYPGFEPGPATAMNSGPNQPSPWQNPTEFDCYDAVEGGAPGRRGFPDMDGGGTDRWDEAYEAMGADLEEWKIQDVNQAIFILGTRPDLNHYCAADMLRFRAPTVTPDDAQHTVHYRWIRTDWDTFSHSWPRPGDSWNFVEVPPYTATEEYETGIESFEGEEPELAWIIAEGENDSFEITERRIIWRNVQDQISRSITTTPNHSVSVAATDGSLVLVGPDVRFDRNYVTGLLIWQAFATEDGLAPAWEWSHTVPDDDPATVSNIVATQGQFHFVVGHGVAGTLFTVDLEGQTVSEVPVPSCQPIQVIRGRIHAADGSWSA